MTPPLEVFFLEDDERLFPTEKSYLFLGSKSWIFRGAVKYVEYDPLEAEGLGFATDVCGLFCPQISLLGS